MTNDNTERNIEYWKEQLRITHNALMKETHPLPTADQTISGNNRLKLCREKIDELEGKK